MPVVSFRPLIVPATQQLNRLGRLRRRMVWHSGVTIGGDDEMARAISSDSSGFPGTIVRLPISPCPRASSRNKDAVFLAHSSVARHAVLIQDGTDVAAEVHSSSEPRRRK